MLWGLIALENELPIAPYWYGVIVFLILMALLAITHGIGKGRPHS